MSKVEMKLNDRQEKFAHEFIVDFDKIKATVRAGYSEKTADQQSRRLYRNVKVRERISELINEEMGTEKTQLRYKLLKELVQIAFADITDHVRIETEEREEEVYDESGSVTGTRTYRRQRVIIDDTKINKDSKAIASIKQDRFGVIELKYHDKLAAIDKLGRYGGLWDDPEDGHQEKGITFVIERATDKTE